MKTNDLEKLGFSEKEAKIYFACLELKRGSSLQIASRAKLPKSTVFDDLKLLVKRGLVSTHVEKGIHRFVALDPALLKTQLQKQMDTLDKYLPELEQIFNTKTYQPTLLRYEGVSGVELVFQNILNDAKELIGISSAEDAYLKLPFFREFVQQRLRKKIPARIILRDCEAARTMQADDRRELRQTKIVQAVPYNAMILVWKNRIGLIALKSDYTAIVVDSPDVVTAFKLMFEILWLQ